MCALDVIRHDSDMRRFYDWLRERGKPGNVSVVGVMRKILLQLNAVARRGTPGPVANRRHYRRKNLTSSTDT